MKEIINLIKQMQNDLQLGSESICCQNYGMNWTIEKVVNEILKSKNEYELLKLTKGFISGKIIFNAEDGDYFYYIENNKLHVCVPNEKYSNYELTNEEIRNLSELSSINNIIDLLWDVLSGERVYILD